MGGNFGPGLSTFAPTAMALSSDMFVKRCSGWYLQDNTHSACRVGGCQADTEVRCSARESRCMLTAESLRHLDQILSHLSFRHLLLCPSQSVASTPGGAAPRSVAFSLRGLQRHAARQTGLLGQIRGATCPPCVPSQQHRLEARSLSSVGSMLPSGHRAPTPAGHGAKRSARGARPAPPVLARAGRPRPGPQNTFPAAQTLQTLGTTLRS